MAQVLAFGDSLTAGFLSHHQHHPYSILLQQKLQNYIPKSQVFCHGVSGETTKNMVKRIPTVFNSIHSQLFFSVILGGTNDLAYVFSVEEIVANLQKINELCLTKSKYTILMTVPQLRDMEKLSENYHKQRNNLNYSIRKYVNQNSNRTFLVDLDQLIPNTNKHLWVDNLHFTIEGYDLMAQLIFNEIEVHLKNYKLELEKQALYHRSLIFFILVIGIFIILLYKYI
eukprot:TRINITY_DN1599_c3_g1_i1.p1 TRINITY_DN1599_c3_g1~~TRINITY_DN1599_c3_g1_i1.p1  ORF type:complete len:227 (-),score=64.37 TRINITY_DN1599_c3_g1_i1:32-712(-)